MYIYQIIDNISNDPLAFISGGGSNKLQRTERFTSSPKINMLIIRIGLSSDPRATQA